MKTVIAGSRDIKDQTIGFVYINEFHKKFPITEVVCGCAWGMDTIGRDWGKDHDIPISLWEADWNNLGKKAGPIRNALMAKHADQALILINNESKGSLNMRQQMEKLKKPFTVIYLTDMRFYKYEQHR